MLTFHYENIWKTTCSTIVVPVNCVGVTGAGLALQFSSYFPAAVAEYRELCDLNKLRIGEPRLLSTSDKPKLLMFPTKRHWTDKSVYSEIELGLSSLSHHMIFGQLQQDSIALPKLGCGCGKLQWLYVKYLIKEYLDTPSFQQRTIKVYLGV